MANVKGNALGGVVRYVQQTHGPTGLDRLLAGLPATDVTLARGIILPAAWYPVGTFTRILESYIRVFGGGDVEKFKPVAEFVAANDLTTIFKVLLTLASPTMVLRRSNLLWGRYFDVGSLLAEELAPTRYMVRLDAPTGVDTGADRIICRVGVASWLETAITMSGAKRAVGRHLRCRFEGAAVCETELSWSE